MSSRTINKVMVGKRLKNLREKDGLTQAELAEIFGVTTNFIGDLERGVKLPSLDTAVKIANYFKISLDDLFMDSLDNVVHEPKEIKFTDKQLIVLDNIIKAISDNFNV